MLLGEGRFGWISFYSIFAAEAYSYDVSLFPPIGASIYFFDTLIYAGHEIVAGLRFQPTRRMATIGTMMMRLAADKEFPAAKPRDAADDTPRIARILFVLSRASRAPDDDMALQAPCPASAHSHAKLRQLLRKYGPVYLQCAPGRPSFTDIRARAYRQQCRLRHSDDFFHAVSAASILTTHSRRCFIGTLMIFSTYDALVITYRASRARLMR